ncbi:MAG: CRISPR-associated endonuclease Cas1 [Chloroflexi bacterium]|nr:CRISPR-associated endonuclease Cas1 [Chloroflexota bacterium]
MRFEIEDWRRAMPTLYVTEPGSRIEKEHGRILVTKEDEVLLAAPLAHVTEVVLMGSVGTTTPALLSLLDHGAGLTLISGGGRLRGRLIAAEARNLPLRHKQYARSGNPAFCLEISRAIVAGKLRNCRALARRMVRGNASREEGRGNALREEGQAGMGETAGWSGQFERMNAALAQVAGAKDLAELRGLEGSGSKAYFAVLRGTLRQGLTFEKRTRRPPKDPVNALLSLAYTLLGNALFTACEVAGLDAYDGFFHADKYGRPALALDLVEEFRPIVADSVVLTVVNKRMVDEADFVAGEDDGVFLSRAGLRRFVAQFGRRLNTPVFHPLAGRALSYQKVFEVQARQLRKAIESGEPVYKPFLAR